MRRLSGIRADILLKWSKAEHIKRKFVKKHHVRLAISMNAPNDEIRRTSSYRPTRNNSLSSIMPINRAEPMALLRKVMIDPPRPYEPRPPAGSIAPVRTANPPAAAVQAPISLYY